jgi:subtilisin family serine protease
MNERRSGGVAVLVALALVAGCATAPRETKVRDWSYVNTRLDPFWWYALVDVPTARQKAGVGANRTVAIVDTGVLGGHEDLAKVGPGVATCGSNPTDATDRNGHGTQLAGIALGRDPGAATRGIAPGAGLLPIKVDCGLVSADSLARGVQRAVESRPDVVLLALGSYPTTTPDVEKVLADRIAASPDILFVIASIWDGSAQFPFPAWTRRDNAIVVAAMTLDDHKREVPFSAKRGDIWAPGRDVQTASIEAAATGPGDRGSPAVSEIPGTRQERGLAMRAHEPYFMQGTSAASAIVAGCAALVKERTGQAGAVLKKTLLTAAEPRPTLGPSDNGRLNCGKALP